ncbi:MAG: phosphonate metabolism protein/1,5-bisphosphokinase (PRPP-forming) PhnN [Bauldia sp.]
MTGAFVAIVGPSGAGKDTLIAEARRTLAGDGGFVFVRRVVTRPSGTFEEHDTVGDTEFARLEAAGAFALSWRAHGLAYGVPSATMAAVEQGAVAVSNLSRAAISAARSRFARVVTILITAPDEVIAARLAARGRETATAAASRLAREATLPTHGASDFLILNDGSPLEGGGKLVACLRRIGA